MDRPQTIQITVVQPDIIWENIPANLERLEKIIAGIPPQTDIIILPEMFNTGFSMNPETLSEKPGSRTYSWMAETARGKNSAVCGSYIVEEDGLYFNRWLFVSPDGSTFRYDKRHLFSPGNEDRLFKKGEEREVFSFRGIRICPTVCYDLRFPVWSRNRNDYDLLINSANWPRSRRDVWLTLLKARAIENQCFVAGANRTGTDGTGTEYCGDSLIIGPRGEIIASDTMNKECLITATVSLMELDQFREKFPVLGDGDEFLIL